MTTVLSQTLNGAVALITGARGQIGRSICAALAAAGARVVATDVGDAPGDLKVDAWMQHDVTSAKDWTHLVDEIRELHYRIGTGH